MIKTITIEGVEMIQPSDLYECMIARISTEKLPENEEDNILRNLRDVDWIQELFDGLDSTIQVFYELTLEKMKNDLIPCPLTWSAMYYNFTKAGINTNEMRISINTSKRLLMELQNIQKKMDDNN